MSPLDATRFLVAHGTFLLALLPFSFPINANELPDNWIDGTVENEPPYQVHEYSTDTWIVRQSLSVHFEAPFIYLLGGDETALLLDTGATTDRWLREVVDRLIGPEFPLVVAHSHAHRDHVAGDAAFEDCPNTRIVGHDAQEVAEFFQIRRWPKRAVTFELGNRCLLIIPIPGHEPSSIAIHDYRTGILLTGDFLYPGRLYVRDFDAYRDSADRLVEKLKETDVTWVLGSHIEMTNHPGQDFGLMQPRHPNERKLELEWQHVLELQQVLGHMRKAEYLPRVDFIIYPLN